VALTDDYTDDPGSTFVELIARVRAHPEWWTFAECRGVNPELFFPERGEGRAEGAAAKAVCALCKVREPCLEYALANGEKSGVWGGVSERDRRRLRSAKCATP